MKLTEKQNKFLQYICQYKNQWGQVPSFDEIREHFSFKSYNTITSYLKVLERKGYVRLPEKNQKRGIEIISPVETSRFELPLLGLVAGGQPIEAIETPDTIEIPPSMVGSGHHFVLQVKGNSMEDAGILDQDFVIIKKQQTAENGTIVVALVNNEATLKKYYKHKDHVELRPAHKGMQSIQVQEGDLRIEGRLIGVLRHYR